MARWVVRFGSVFIATAIVWAIFSISAAWTASGGGIPGTNVRKVLLITWAIGLATFGATIVSAAMHWAEQWRPANQLS
jgi:hypothetical protein